MATPAPYDLEPIYDAQIAPLMTQIIAICKGHGMPMLATFAFRRDDNEEYDCCTTLLGDKNNQGPITFAHAAILLLQ